jgi:uncharacterized phosphosugar-binding protein
MLATTWLRNAHEVMERIAATQLENISRAAEVMAQSIAAERWVHTFGCGHATLPVEEMYPRIGGFVGFHPMIELPLTYFTHITGEMGIHQFLFLERAEGFGRALMRSYDFDPRDTMWIFSHSGLNPVNIDVAMAAKDRGLPLVVTGSQAAYRDEPPRHSSGAKLFDLADVVVDTCVPAADASIPLPGHVDRVGPVSTVAFMAAVWMTVTTVAERLIERGVKLFIHPSHNIPGDTTARERLDAALREYKRRVAGV